MLRNASVRSNSTLRENLQERFRSSQICDFQIPTLSPKFIKIGHCLSTSVPSILSFIVRIAETVLHQLVLRYSVSLAAHPSPYSCSIHRAQPITAVGDNWSGEWRTNGSRRMFDRWIRRLSKQNRILPHSPEACVHAAGPAAAAAVKDYLLPVYSDRQRRGMERWRER